MGLLTSVGVATAAGVIPVAAALAKTSGQVVSFQ